MATKINKKLNPTNKKRQNSSIYFYYYNCTPLAELNVPIMQLHTNVRNVYCILFHRLVLRKSGGVPYIQCSNIYIYIPAVLRRW